MTVTTDVLPMLFTEVEVVSVERLSPAFVRVELGGSALADFGVDGPLWDQRIKLIFPDPETGAITSVEGADESWLATWLDRPASERGHMRTYTVREVRGSGAETTLVVDIVVHLDAGATGPGSLWAAAASTGDRLVLLAPRRGYPFGGIEFVPPAGAELLLVADETAVPAVCAILAQLPADATGAAFLEVPESADVLPVLGPQGVAVNWLPRDGALLGERLHSAVVDHLGLPGGVISIDPDAVDPELWETPTYSSSGEPLAEAPASIDRYAWIAGESKVVTGLRRHLVRDLGIDRAQVAFMGYWRRGVAMKS